MQHKLSKAGTRPGDLALGDHKGPFVPVSPGFIQTTSDFIWILNNTEAEVLKLLGAGFCSNPVPLGTAKWDETVRGHSCRLHPLCSVSFVVQPEEPGSGPARVGAQDLHAQLRENTAFWRRCSLQQDLRAQKQRVGGFPAAIVFRGSSLGFLSH